MALKDLMKEDSPLVLILTEEQKPVISKFISRLIVFLDKTKDSKVFFQFNEEEAKVIDDNLATAILKLGKEYNAWTDGNYNPTKHAFILEYKSGI